MTEYPHWHKRTIHRWPWYGQLWPLVKPLLIWWALVALILSGVLLWIALLPHPMTNAERIWFCQSDIHC